MSRPTNPSIVLRIPPAPLTGPISSWRGGGDQKGGEIMGFDRALSTHGVGPPPPKAYLDHPLWNSKARTTKRYTTSARVLPFCRHPPLHSAGVSIGMEMT